MKASNAVSKTPLASKFVSSPLRNRIKLELNASVNEVWQLVGDPGKMPDYSEGLKSVETKQDENGNYTEYLCHFKPTTEGEPGIDHQVVLKWYEPFKGWASLDDEPNAFGLKKSLTLITIEPKNDKTLLRWDMHFNADDIDMNRSSLEIALNDISKRLIDHFGGRVIENYVEGKKQ